MTIQDFATLGLAGCLIAFLSVLDDVRQNIGEPTWR